MAWGGGAAARQEDAAASVPAWGGPIPVSPWREWEGCWEANGYGGARTNKRHLSRHWIEGGREERGRREEREKTREE